MVWCDFFMLLFVFKNTNKDIGQSWTKRVYHSLLIELFMYNFVEAKFYLHGLFLEFNKDFLWKGGSWQTAIIERLSLDNNGVHISNIGKDA